MIRIFLYVVIFVGSYLVGYNSGYNSGYSLGEKQTKDIYERSNHTANTTP